MLMRGRGFLVLAVVTVAVVAGALLVTKREPSQAPEVGALLFPALLARVNDVVQVDVRAGEGAFRLERKGQAWVAPGRGDYRLDGDKVHNLVVGAAGLQRLEPKTSDPARFAELGLQDPDQPDARSVEFQLRAGGDEVLAQVIVGERRAAKGDANRTEYFVRVPGEERSWLVRGTLPADADNLVDWLDRRIATISGARIARVQVTHADGETVSAVRDAPGGGDFGYQQLPDGAELTGVWAINDIGRVLTDLSLEEVQPATQASPGDGALEAVSETFDGLRVRLRAWRDGERTLATLGAEFDEALVRKSADDKPGEGLLPAAEVREEAARLDARWQPWVFELPRYKGDYLRRRQADLVKAPEKTPEAAPQTPPPGGAPAVPPS